MPFSFGDVTTLMCRRRPFSSWWPTSGNVTMYLPRPEVDPLVLEVEGHEQCPLRDLPLLLDRRTHVSHLSVRSRRGVGPVAPAGTLAPRRPDSTPVAKNDTATFGYSTTPRVARVVWSVSHTDSAMRAPG